MMLTEKSVFSCRRFHTVYRTFSMGRISQLKKSEMQDFFLLQFPIFRPNNSLFASTIQLDKISFQFSAVSFNRAVANFPLPTEVFFGGIVYYTWTSLRHKDHVNVLWDKIISQTFAIRPKMCVCEQENHVYACRILNTTHTTKCEKEDPYSTDKMCRVYLIFWPTHYTSCECSSRIFLLKYYLKPVSFHIKPYHLPFVNVFKPSKIWDELFNLFRCISSSAQKKLLHNYGCWFWRVLGAFRHGATRQREMETEARKRERKKIHKHSHGMAWTTKKYPPNPPVSTLIVKWIQCVRKFLCVSDIVCVSLQHDEKRSTVFAELNKKHPTFNIAHNGVFPFTTQLSLGMPP